MAGWGEDPELERLRALIEQGWQPTEVTIGDPGGAGDTVTLSKDGETVAITSDHLAFHHYAEGLKDEQGL